MLTNSFVSYFKNPIVAYRATYGRDYHIYRTCTFIKDRDLHRAVVELDPAHICWKCWREWKGRKK